MKLRKMNTRTPIIDKHRKNSGDGIHCCETPDDKERGVDFTPSTSTTIKRSRRNDETIYP
jgi:hypothetical protein